MQVLYDRDLCNIDIVLAANALRLFLVDDDNKRTSSPPRHAANLGADRLIFTIGGDTQHIGFRVYSSREDLYRDKEEQVVACWDKQSHKLLAIAVGQLLGAWRTGVLGGIARQAVGPVNYDICGVIGTGLQAATQAKATGILSPPKRFLVYSRTPEHRVAFANEITASTGVPVDVAESARMVVEQSDSLIVATTSHEPVIELGWLERCQHVSTVGPKLLSSHELPTETFSWADLIVSDSPQQIAAQGQSHFLAAHVQPDQILHIGKLLAQDSNVQGGHKSLYLSAGLSGTEVALLAALVKE